MGIGQAPPSALLLDEHSIAIALGAVGLDAFDRRLDGERSLHELWLYLMIRCATSRQ